MSQLEPLLEPVRDRARSSSEPCSMISVTQSDVNPAELAFGEEEQRLERRDREAMDQAQAKFEEEESQYYQEVERAVQEHMQTQEARRYQAWEDWAMFDEMRGGHVAGRGRKRLFLEVTVGPRGGEAGPEQRLRMPLDERGGGQVLLSVVPAMAEDGGDNATTVRASPAPAGNPELVPLPFDDFMRLFHRWQAGHVTGEAVVAQYGASTLEMLETQLLVKQGALEESMEEQSAAGVGQVIGQPGPEDGAETLLDAMLDCTPEAEREEQGHSGCGKRVG
eukprot:s1625_g7.t1